MIRLQSKNKGTNEQAKIQEQRNDRAGDNARTNEQMATKEKGANEQMNDEQQSPEIH